MLNHQHLIVDCFVRKPLTSTEKTIEFLRTLVAALGMKIVAGPISAYCDAHENNGITGAVCIQTSHCSIHVWDKVEEPYMKLDVYSCQSFDTKVVMDLIQEFDPYDITSEVINRNP